MNHAIALTLLMVPTLVGQPHTYQIVPGDSNRLELRVYKTGLYKGKVHLFVFPKYQGMFTYDPQHPEASTVKLTIAAADIKLMDTWLSAKDFKSVQEYAVKDMLNSVRYPEILFASTQVRSIDANRFEVRGNLTIRGVSKPSVMNVTLQSAEVPKVEGKAVIKLTDFGLKPPSAALGLVGTKDEMDFSFTVLASPGS